MKKVIANFILATFVLLSCNIDSDSNSNSHQQNADSERMITDLDTADMQTISLADYGLNLNIKLPVVATASGSEIKPKVEHIDGDYLWYINIGEQFKLVIEDYAKEFNKVQWHQKQLEMQKDVFDITYLKQEPHLLFYKRDLIDNSGGAATFHCYAELEVEGYNYVLRSHDFGGFEQVIKDMVVAIKTARPITKAKS